MTPVSGLLVSVRSAEEARSAVAGGASVVDVKEPDRGPLGKASVETWRAVREAVPSSIPVSVALGELCDYPNDKGSTEYDIEGIAFRKIGLAQSGPDWRADWAKVRRSGPGKARWVAVAYADWSVARAPDPFDVLETALEVPECVGLLVDTWDKARKSALDTTAEWMRWVGRAQDSGRFVALAGGLDLASIVRLAPLRPDLFAVRGAACEGHDRRGTVNAERVTKLVQVIRTALGRPTPVDCD